MLFVVQSSVSGEACTASSQCKALLTGEDTKSIAQRGGVGRWRCVSLQLELLAVGTLDSS